VDDPGPVDREAAVVGRGQARRLAGGAVDAGDNPHDRQTTWWWLSLIRDS
jgi:hypothetical protein